ncbi:MAG: hypothetical protein U1E43_07595 [Rhodospirillales bacterium]
MIRLDLKREPYWLDLPGGVRLRVAPCSTHLMMAARQQIDGFAGVDRGAALVRALARVAILEWEGVGDADGNPVEPTPEHIDALLDLWPIAAAFERDYLAPAVMLDAEKNA